MEVLPGEAGSDRRVAELERLETQRVVLAQLVRRLADGEGPRHVGEAPRGDVAREQVEQDDVVRRHRPTAHVVTDRRLRAVGDDELVARYSPFAANARSTWCLISSQVSVSPSTTRPPFAGVARRSRSAAAVIPASAAVCARRMPASSGCRLDAPAVVEQPLVDDQLDPRRAKMVGDRERELARRRSRAASPR